MKKLVAYSSVAHMGFVTLGFFVFNTAGLEGAIVQMISHGFVSGAMFLCIGVLYERLHTRRIDAYGGVVNVMPRFVTLRSEEHTSELQSLMRISYAVFCLKKKKKTSSTNA